ncbi:endonuclease NucS domain-containing protein [Pseudomonas citronellolis]|uniref:endonuclease NucS domain-containing protein n=1 Tax=Pseudomonas citronellolis TaxID=53408 RepID=UPI000AF382AA|nr:endonuclease NucS domain-containing protein [Pseudomonas citronellolis]
MSSNGNRPPVWQMVKEAAQQMVGEITYQAIKAKVKSIYGNDIKDSSITCSIISGAVNHPSRIHYNENKKPRIADTAYDYLFSTGRGRVTWYQPEKHGVWEIAHSANGALIVRLSDVEDDPMQIAESIEAGDDTYGMFALEAHLRDYLAKKLPKLPGHDSPLILYRTEDRDGVEFQTDVGPIDILATGNGDFYVLELKVGRGPDAALGQILRYMGWVKEHLAGDKNVHGIIIASDIGQKLRYAATQVPNVRLMEYDLAVTLRSVALHP